MSRITQAAAASQTLSLTAMEEASRLGQREADIEHMLLALTLSDQPAGQVLRGLGASLSATREAVAAQRAEALSSLGVTADFPEGERIDFHETGGYDWSKRCLEIIRRARPADAAGFLRELLQEPSGLIDDLLRRVGTSPDEVLTRLDEVDRIPSHTSHAPKRDEVSGFTESFVPAPVEEVWTLLRDPSRMTQWDPAAGRVDWPVETSGASGHPAEETARTAASAPRVGDVWLTHAHTERPDGRPLRVRERYRRRRVELTAAEEHARIAWRFSALDAPRPGSARVEITLSPAAGGTQLGITVAMRKRCGWRGFIGLLLRPLQRFAIWMQLFHIGGALSRAFR